MGHCQHKFLGPRGAGWQAGRLEFQGNCVVFTQLGNNSGQLQKLITNVQVLILLKFTGVTPTQALDFVDMNFSASKLRAGTRK